MQNYSETSGIQVTAAVYHRSDIITKEPLRLVNSMKCDKSNLIRKKLAFFSIFVRDTRTEGSSPLSIYALGIFLDLHVEKGCFKPKSFKKQVNVCENSLSQLWLARHKAIFTHRIEGDCFKFNKNNSDRQMHVVCELLLPPPPPSYPVSP